MTTPGHEEEGLDLERTPGRERGLARDIAVAVDKENKRRDAASTR